MTTPQGGYSELVANSLQMVQSAKASYDSYQAANQAQASILQTKQTLEAKLNEQTRALQELSRVESTYDKDYLDVKAAGGLPKTAFGVMGLTSTQDWVLFLYFLSFGVCSVAVLLYVTYRSTKKLQAFLFVGAFMALVGLFSTLAIRYYG